jgi:hypothetical protein
MAGLLLIVLPLCPATQGPVPDVLSGRSWSMCCLALAGWIADRQVARRHSADDTRRPFDRAWSDFRELFGIVWAKRIQERFNDDARRRGHSLRLGFQGLEAVASGHSSTGFDAASRAAAESSLRWLLQKFVDAEWLEKRLIPMWKEKQC